MEYTLYFLLILTIPLTIIFFFMGRLDGVFLFSIISYVIFLETEAVKEKPLETDYVLVDEKFLYIVDIKEIKNMIAEDELSIKTRVGSFKIWSGFNPIEDNGVFIKYYEIPEEKRLPSYSHTVISRFEVCGWDSKEKAKMCEEIEIFKSEGAKEEYLTIK